MNETDRRVSDSAWPSAAGWCDSSVGAWRCKARPATEADSPSISPTSSPFRERRLLPDNPQHSSNDPQRAPTSRSGTPPRVLLVEDDLITASALLAIL